MIVLLDEYFKRFLEKGSLSDRKIYLRRTVQCTVVLLCYDYKVKRTDFKFATNCL